MKRKVYEVGVQHRGDTSNEDCVVAVWVASYAEPIGLGAIYIKEIEVNEDAPGIDIKI